MGYIYKITNKLTGKSYIGQTVTSIPQRMSKHYSHAKVATTGIDFALQKYGKDNFTVEQLCECNDDALDDLERYYIQHYDTYNNGYNLTVGGQDISTKLQLDEKQIVADYLEGSTITALTAKYHCCEKTISNILHNHSVKIRYAGTTSFKKGDNIKAVRIKELNLQFPSFAECAQWLIDNGYAKTTNMETARKGISRMICGLRNTYCGFHFEKL